jgi:hypothetical protein
VLGRPARLLARVPDGLLRTWGLAAVS